jgi:hypothetical protein
LQNFVNPRNRDRVIVYERMENCFQTLTVVAVVLQTLNTQAAAA